MTTALLILTFSTALVASTTTEQPTELRNALYTFDPVKEDTFACFRWNYHKFIARVWSAEGVVDEIGINDTKNAAAAGMIADGSFIPCANEGCDAADEQLFTGLKAAGARIETLWIYVEKTAFNWRTDVQANRDFITRLVETAEMNGQRVGIASTRSEYEIIFGDAFTNFSSIPMCPSVEPTEEEPSTTASSGGLRRAYSTTSGLQQSQVECLKRTADRAIFRVSMMDGNPDHGGIRNVLLARDAGFERVDGTLTMCTIEGKCSEAVQQLDTLVVELVKARAHIDTLWIRAHDPGEWLNNTVMNKMALNEIVLRFDSLTNLCLPFPIRLGIASYNISYNTIFDSAFHDFARRPLWWTWPSGFPGVDEFTSFGGWNRPEMHVFYSEIHCECDDVCRDKAPLVVNYYGKSMAAWIGSGAAVLLVIALIIVICLCLRRKREQEFRKQLQLIKESHSRDGSFYDRLQTIPFDRDNWEISRQEIVINYDDKLGNGSFGYVYSGQLIFEGNRVPTSIREARLTRNALKKVAVKTLPDIADSLDRKDFHLEICTMKELRFHEREEVPPDQLKSGQEPSSAVHELISLKDQLMFAVQIATGLEYLTQRGYVHRDIAARNILLDDNNACKIGDFGLCRRVEQAHDNYTSRGGRLPIKWMSPEAIVQFLFSTKSDVWSYGVVLFEIMTLASPPYPSWSVAEVLERLNKNERMNKPDACPNEVFEIMMRCWNQDPADRPDFTRIRDETSRLLAKASDDNYYLQLRSGENYYALHRRK